ncbi:hypothetical protein P3T76_001431 [Phytophthora citrophthora]|uniref:Uncharacterized protein n=1 Tax=Phytophthora citrophthora TaxID=4793 RepID=A0AAD9LSV3_9STRA|nr:hypothetical protein P3T76_001431 [Phytophthora citrophthora]
MSLGFLTESALVPSKAKEIKVDNKSLVDLKAVVFQKDQERKRRLKEALTAENDEETPGLRLGKYAHLRRGNKHQKRSKEDFIGRNHRNRGVEARNRLDEEAKAREAPDEDDDEAWAKKSAEMLRKKAKLYEEMANGGKDHLKGECLVNFDAKKALEKVAVVRERTMVEIMDEFGRTRQVASDSEEYAAYLEMQQAQNTKGDGYYDVIEDREGEDRTRGGSFVVSQWEKRFKPSEKDHLKEVHERAALAQSLAHASSTGQVDRKSRKQLRLERLRKQKEEAVMTSGSVMSTDTEADTAASKKATDFLNQLSSLMK